MIGISHMELLMDLLVLQEGPRIRDKISHGEVEYDDKSAKMCVELVMASYLDLVSIIRKTDTSNSKETIGGVSKLITCGYEPQYHPTILLEENIRTALSNVENVLPDKCNLYLHSSDSEEDGEKRFDIFCDNSAFFQNLNHLMLKLIQPSDYESNKKEIEVSNIALHISRLLWPYLGLPENCGNIYTNYTDAKVSSISTSTLYRPKREYELWSISRKIVSHITRSTLKIKENLEEKKAQFECQTLRSRQRSTYKRMLNTIPLINVTFLCLFIIILNHLLDFYQNNVLSVNEDNFSKTMNKSKQYLKICENLDVYVDKSKNRWEESIEIVRDFIKVFND